MTRPEITVPVLHVQKSTDYGLMKEEKIRKIEKRLQVLEKTGGGPGQCQSEETCEAYCSDVTHIKECVAFATEHVIMEKQELEEAEKVQQAVERGACAFRGGLPAGIWNTRCLFLFLLISRVFTARLYVSLSGQGILISEKGGSGLKRQNWSEGMLLFDKPRCKVPEKGDPMLIALMIGLGLLALMMLVFAIYEAVITFKGGTPSPKLNWLRPALGPLAILILALIGLKALHDRRRQLAGRRSN